MGEVTEVVCYIISTHYGTYYCGITNCMLRRWKEHVGNQSKYLSTYKAKEVVFIEVYGSYSEARQREKQIKKGGVGRFFMKWKLQTGYYNATINQR